MSTKMLLITATIAMKIIVTLNHDGDRDEDDTDIEIKHQ